jgi:ornithine cyclodeaminase
MALYLHEDEVRQLLTMKLALEALEEVHRDHAAGLALDTPRNRTRLPQTTMHLLQGAVTSLGVVGYKAYTSSRDGTRFLVHLYDALTGGAAAVIEADYLGMMRTGAASGIAARWLARKDSRTAGIFGAGWQAQGQIESLCAVLDIECFKVHARNAERLRDFCETMSARTGRDVVPAKSARETVEGSEIVVTITTSPKPLFDGEWLAPGTHINAAGSNSLVRRELDEQTVRRCGLVCVDSRSVALKESGDLQPLLEKGRLHEGQLIELGEVIAGIRSGRGGADQITLFESHGMAIQDLAVAQRLLALARERGLGSELPY